MASRKPTMLLVSIDDVLIDAVQEITNSIGNLELAVLAGVDEARAGVTREDVALLLVHLKGEGDPAEVTDLIRVIAEAGRPVPTVAISDRHQAKHSLAILRAGVADHLSRPLDLSRLTYLIDVLTMRARLARPAFATDAPGPAPCHRLGDGVAFLYQTDTAMGRLMGQVRRVASQDTTVLLGGETGTGKTRMARLIHELSPRRDSPFLVVNCGALSTTLIESEMFGHVKGAFTGADRDRTGKFAEVGGGTLLLDEVDALPLELQAKLLRAVEERIFEPVGSNRSQPVRARLIAASNRALDQEAAAGRFRLDLYYRLNVIAFTLPPLRERRNIIPHLVGGFIAEIAGRGAREVDGISAEALAALAAHAWTGNIRELRNVIERAIVLCADREIQVEDLPEEFQRGGAAPMPRPAASRSPVGTPTLARTMDDAERARISDALERNQYKRLLAAAELGISRVTLYKKMLKYGLMGVA